MSRGRIIAGVVVLAVIAAVVGGVLYSSSTSAPSVTTAKATTETLGVLVTASGKIEGARRSDVYPPTAGTLKDVEVSDGETVTAGTVLAVMDTGPLTAQVRAAASQLAAARAQLDAVDRGVPSAIDRAAASAGVAAAQASYDAAKKAYDSFKAVFDEATPTVQASLEGTLTQLTISKKQAYAALENAKSGSGKLSVAARVSVAKASANSAVDAASFALKLAKDTLSKATMTAPIGGVVVFNPTGAPGTDSALPKPQEGSAVAPGSAPFTVVDLGSVNFDAQVDEADVAKVASGMKASVTLDAFPGTTFKGTVSAVRATAIQTTTGGIAFPVLVGVDAAASRLLIGMSGSADIQVEAVSAALTVPIESVLDESGKKYVFVVSATDTVKKTQVTTGALTDTSAQILSGINAGDTVVTSQLTTLKDGMAVRPQ